MAKSVQPSTLKWPRRAGRADERRQRAGNRADERVDLGDALERRIDEDVNDQRQRPREARSGR